jgi:hypothetical protein
VRIAARRPGSRRASAVHRAALLAVAVGVAGLLAPAAAPAQVQKQTLQLGFLDTRFDGPAQGPWLERAAAAGGDLARLLAPWRRIAPARPTAPENPADPAYQWARTDASVRDAAARGLSVILCLTSAPRWAEGPNRPRRAIGVGSWRPDAAAYGAFAKAAAERYSGRYPDPARPGATLPRVTLFQAWNEPNLPRYLSPQWVGTAPASPGIYRDMLNAFTAGVKAAQPAATVIAANTAPFGDPPGAGTGRMQPLTFDRELLSQPTFFDVLAHHPYAIRGPSDPARNIGDVSIGNVSDLVDELRAAEKRGTAPGGRKRMWITEFSWDGAPDPEGVPEPTRARWIAEALYVSWKQKVDTLIWFLAGDQPAVPSYSATYQSGMYFADGRPKLGLRAFQFPVIADRMAGDRADVWVRAPYAGTLVIEQRRKGGRWKSAASIRVKRHDVVLKRIKAKLGTQVRGRMGTQKSLISRVRTVW